MRGKIPDMIAQLIKMLKAKHPDLFITFRYSEAVGGLVINAREKDLSVELCVRELEIERSLICPVRMALERIERELAQ